jgi:hypothetical protein
MEMVAGENIKRLSAIRQKGQTSRLNENHSASNYALIIGVVEQESAHRQTAFL